MATTPTKAERGRQFFSEVLSKLPENLQAEMQTYLQSDAAGEFLTAVADGTMRQSDFSRAHNALAEQKAALERWQQSLETWREQANNDYLSGRKINSKPGDPNPDNPDPNPDPAPSGGLDPTKVKAAIGQELNDREIHYANFMAETTRLSTEHYAKFGKVLDLRPVLAHPELQRLGLEGTYRLVHKAEFDAADAKAAADREAQIRKDERDKVLAEVAASPLPGSVPDGGGSGSPLDFLGDKSDFSVDAAVRAYRELTQGR